MIAFLMGTALAGDVWMVVDSPEVRLELPAAWVDSDADADVFAAAEKLAKQPVGSVATVKTADSEVRLEHRPIRAPATRELVIKRGGFAMSVAMEPGKPSVSLEDLSIDTDAVHLSMDDASDWAPVMRAEPTVLVAGKGPKPVLIEVR